MLSCYSNLFWCIPSPHSGWVLLAFGFLLLVAGIFQILPSICVFFCAIWWTPEDCEPFEGRSIFCKLLYCCKEYEVIDKHLLSSACSVLMESWGAHKSMENDHLFPGPHTGNGYILSQGRQENPVRVHEAAFYVAVKGVLTPELEMYVKNLIIFLRTLDVSVSSRRLFHELCLLS